MVGQLAMIDISVGRDADIDANVAF